MSKNLWPEFEAMSKSTPKTVVENAGAGLEEKTAGLVRFFLDSPRISNGFVILDCKLYAPKISYMYPFLKVKFPVADGYPVELVADKIPETFPAANEEELLRTLGKIFQSPSTIDTIQNLIALC